ncbi:MAG: pyridoxamine 5'-phosphate oxidase family protein [Chitinispirillaceae bacterium]|nr:pyridoxamine 5'-phosphate oxidase family protein [Chitinispirillaceae bacterium]
MTKKLPDEVMNAWQEREGPLVLITVSKNGIPNAIYASIVKIIDDGRIAVVDNYFDKTKLNIDEGNCKASALFIASGHKSYQIKGSVEYHTQGPLYEEILSWADPKHPRKGVAIINCEEVYRGKDRLA